MEVIIHSHIGRGEYFFSTSHCQKTAPGIVPTTFYLPMRVVARPTLPSGLVETADDVVKVFFYDAREIRNPDPHFQPKR